VTATAGIYPVVYLDPMVIDRRYTSSVMPPLASIDTTYFFSPVAFQGAFGGKNWAAWTYVAKLGLMPDDNYGEFNASAGGNFQTNANIVAAAITDEGDGTLSFSYDAPAYEGYVGDVSIGYYNTTVPKRYYGYNFKTGTWQGSVSAIHSMPLGKLNLKKIINKSAMPAGTQFLFKIDTYPNGIFDANGRIVNLQTIL